MGKLSPPILATTIPAFYSKDEGIVITIPFTMNRAVSVSSVKKCQVKIKTVQSGNVLYNEQVDFTMDNIVIYINNDEIVKQFYIGQFYKVQMAYVDKNDVVGYYSTVAVGKFTTKPELSIAHLDTNVLNSHIYEYQGVYNQEDITERVYSYQFDLYDNTGAVIATSGLLLHNTDLDDIDSPNTSIDKYIFTQDLLVGQTYKIQYTVTTNNGLTISSPYYRVTQKRSIEPELKATLTASLNYDNGYIDLNLQSAIPENEINKLASGFFIVSRACENTNYSVWDEVYRFRLIAQIPTMHLCKDFTIEQGKNYRYSIQQYNSNGLRSSRILSNIIYSDFEDAFLFDGKRQLKIKYNPKVSSFKKDLLETKTDTIGGKHPFIFRNGRVYYSEFPISGLISYQMDEENLFLSEEDYGLVEKTTNITGDNIAAERIFKMKVLEWLTNGEPKIFRSPTEGNYIVRLMNSSMSPNDTVGRMLHTFTSTAYEIADFNYATLGKMEFISTVNNTVAALHWETINFISRNSDNELSYVATGENLLPLNTSAITLQFNDMIPGEIVWIKFKGASDFEEIRIGATGSYWIDTGVEIVDVRLPESKNPVTQGTMTYSFYYNYQPKFEMIHSVDVIERPAHQFIGEHDIIQEILCVWDEEHQDWVQNPKVELVEIYRIDVEKRPLQRVTEEPSTNDNPFLLYEVGENTLSSGPRPGYPNSVFTREYYYDTHNKKKYDNENEVYEPYIKLNGEIISVNEIERTEFLRPGLVNELQSGNGSFVTLSYQLCDITYNIEQEALNITDHNHYLYDLGEKIKAYNTAKFKLDHILSDANMIEYPAAHLEDKDKTGKQLWGLTNFTSEKSKNGTIIKVTFSDGSDNFSRENGVWFVNADSNDDMNMTAVYYNNKIIDNNNPLSWADETLYFYRGEKRYEYDDGDDYPVVEYIDDNFIEMAYEDVRRTYNEYILALVEAQTAERVRKGEIIL